MLLHLTFVRYATRESTAVICCLQAEGRYVPAEKQAAA